MILQRIEGKRGGSGRHYVRADSGIVVPAVTTVVSLTPKPYLMNWVVKLAAEYAACNITELYPLTVEERVADIKVHTRELREEGARKGTALHEYAEQRLWLGPARLPQNPAEQGVEDIIELLQPSSLASEAMVWNGDVGYAGTLDGIWDVEWQGRTERWLIDWKTSKSRSIEWAMQQEAYRRAETVILADRVEVPMPKVDRAVILWTPYAGGWSLLEVPSSDLTWEAFKSSLQVLRWQEATGVAAAYDCLTTEAQQQQEGSNGHV